MGPSSIGKEHGWVFTTIVADVRRFDPAAPFAATLLVSPQFRKSPKAATCEHVKGGH